MTDRLNETMRRNGDQVSTPLSRDVDQVGEIKGQAVLDKGLPKYLVEQTDGLGRLVRVWWCADQVDDYVPF